MFITIRISLESNVTKKQITKLALYIAKKIKKLKTTYKLKILKNIYISINEGDGDYLGP